jgi:hypothetical protein
MDAAFVPSEIVVKHFVSHKFTLEIGPSITALGRPLAKLILAAVVIYCVGDIARVSLQAVLKKSRGGTEDDT